VHPPSTQGDAACRLDFADKKRAVFIIKNKDHLNPEGTSPNSTDLVVPAYVAVAFYPYPNLIKKFILTVNKGKSGIYMLTHEESGCRNVGSAI
jgi:hypothetical protein